MTLVSLSLRTKDLLGPVTRVSPRLLRSGTWGGERGTLRRAVEPPWGDGVGVQASVSAPRPLRQVPRRVEASRQQRIQRARAPGVASAARRCSLLPDTSGAPPSKHGAFPTACGGLPQKQLYGCQHRL